MQMPACASSTLCGSLPVQLITAIDFAGAQPRPDAPFQTFQPPFFIVRSEGVMKRFFVKLMLGVPAAGTLVEQAEPSHVVPQAAAQEIEK